MNLNQKIQSFLKRHKNTKRRLSATALLSMLITLSVVSSLIMPAISMTMSEFISSTDAGSIAVYGATPGSYTNVANSQMLDILSADEYAMNISSNDNYFYEATQGGVTKNENFKADSSPIDLSFNITYSFKNSIKDKIPGNGPHLGLDLGNPNLTAVFPNNMDHGEIDDPNYTGGKAGDYVINNGRIEITLTSDYINYLNSGNGTIEGTLDFSGSLGRSNTADGDQTFTVNGQTVTIDFSDQHPTINKQYSIDNTNGTVNWTLTVYNTANIDLGGYTITDSMFTTYNDAVTNSISFNPSEAGTYSNGVFTFNQGFNRTPITITYKTPITEEMLKDSSKRTNSATINKGTEYTSEKVERTVDLNNPFNVRKKGQTDYSQGKGYGNKIDWTITIDNNYGVSLDNYLIEDENIPDGTTFSVSPSGSLENDSNGKWKLSGVGNAKQVVITYQTNATVGDNSNTAKLEYPDGTPTNKEGTDTVNYPEKKTLVGITKDGNVSNGLANWTIMVSNQNNIDLNGYTVTDDMLANAINTPTIDPANAAKFENNTITLNSDSKNTRLITITYQTKITAADLNNIDNNTGKSKVSNNAVLKDPDGGDPKEAPKDILFEKNGFGLTKSGTPDYNINGQYPESGNKIKWKIEITNNDRFYLDGYIIEDTQIPDSGGTVSPSGSLTKVADSNGKWELTNVGNPQKITIEYDAAVPKDKIGSTVTNLVKFENPEKPDEPIKETTGQVEYKNESDLVTLGKSGNYDQNAHKINWSIHVQVDGGYNLTGRTIFDEMFKTIPIENIRINNQSVETYATIDQSTGILTFKSHPGNAFDITYSQDVNIPEVTSPTTTVVANGYGPGPGTTSTATVNVNVREELTKTVTANDNGTPETAAEITRELNWVARITHDGKFDGKVFKDTLQQPTPSGSGTHKMTDSQFNNIAVYGSVYGSDNTGNMSLLTKGTDYEIVKNGDSGFEIKFKGTLDEKGYNFVRIEYKTTVTANKLSMDPKPDFPNSVTFKNKAEFNSLNAEQSYTITRKDPTKNEKMSLNIKKKWESDNETIRPEKAYFKVFYKKTGSNDWTQLKFAGDSYLFSGDSGYSSGTEILEIANNNSNEWNKTLSNLPSLIRGVKDDGTPDTEIYYTYKIEEVDASGKSLTNNRLDSGDGFYNVSYENNNGVGYNGAVITATNTYYGNSDLTPKKTWSDGQNGIQSVKVRLEFKVDGQWFPVRKDGDNYVFTKDSSETDNIAYQELNNNGSWTGTAWENLPGAVLIDGQYKPSDYRIVEIGYTKDDRYNEITGNKFILDNGYYIVSNTDKATVHNAFNPTKALTYSAQKNWAGEDSGGINHRPSGLIIQLEYSTNNWEYFPVRVDADGKYILDKASSADIVTQTINTGSAWKCGWQNLPNQSFTESGDVITYTYRAREVGYVYGDKTVTLKGNEGEEFAVDSAGWYSIGSYSDDSNNNITTITNDYHLVGTIAITPQKKWEKDSENLDNRPASVKFQLQKQYNNTGDWTPVNDADGNPLTVTLTSDNAYEYDSTIWQGEAFSNLQREEIVIDSVTGKSTKRLIRYRLVEIAYTPQNGSETAIAEDATEFRLDNGRYEIKNDETKDTNGSITITNTFTKRIGIEKFIIDDSGIGKSHSSIDREILTAENSTFRKTIDGEQYYVFNWQIMFDAKNRDEGLTMRPLSDKLPDGFTLCTDDENWGSGGKKVVPDNNPADQDQYTPLEEGRYGLGIKGYYAHPTYVWPTYWAISANKDSNVDSIWSHSGTETAGGDSVYYFYDTTNNTVYFNRPTLWAPTYIVYSTKIKCEDLEAKLANGSLDISNYAIKHELNGTPIDGEDASATLKIINKVDQKLITKTYLGATRIPGYFKYSIDVNPQGKNLSNGDTIDIQDLLETVSYFDHDIGSSGETTTGKKLVDILMDSIKIYEVDANGNKIELPKNAYTLMFENGDKVTDGAALMKLTVPDETHIVVDYTYKMIANANTPSVIHGCKSSTRVNGRYAIMKPGFVPPADDIIKFKNTAKLISDSASDESTLDKTEYKVFKSSGMITTTLLPKIVKVDTGDYSINELQAKFLIAKYENGKWYYAVEINDGGPYGTGSNDRVITWDVNGAQGTKIPENTDLKLIEVRKSYEVALDESVLYKLIEVQVPENYEGSNLGLGTNKEEENENFKKLLARYLNSGVTYFNGKDYSNFLNKYVSTHYFAYNSVITDYPDGVAQSDVMQIKSGDDVEIPNNQLIDIGIKKEWINPRGSIADTSVNVELYWSATKNSSKIPDDAQLADAADLGIMDSGFTAQKTVDVTDEQGNALDTSQIWTDLPNGKDDKPIYYYIKETGYTIGGETYTLDKDGSFTSESGAIGAYKPTYIGNAANTDADINIKNSHQLMLKKQWKNSANVIMANPPVNEVKVSIFGIDADGEKRAEPLFKDIVLSSENNWTVDLTSLIQEIDLSQYKSFVAEEVDDPLLESYVVSCVFNLNGSIGEITVTNKNTEASDASVTVNKVWSDGEAVHSNESIKATLYQSKTKLSADELKSIENRISANTNLYWIMQPIDENDKQKYEDVILNAESSWSYTWTGLPLEDEEQNPYYYYVVEDKSGITNANSYTASYEYLSQTSTNTKYKITNTRQAIVVQKKWLEEDGVTIIPDNKLAQDSITLDVLKNIPGKWEPTKVVNDGWWQGSPGTSDETALQKFEDDCNKRIDDCNTLTKTIANPDQNIYFADVCAAVDKDSMLYDGCHPNAVGMEKIASAYETVIRNIYTQTPSKLNIMCLGDSITDASLCGLANASEENYPKQLENKLKSDYGIDNISVIKNGQNSQQIPGFADRISGINSDTDIVCVLGGTNDIHQNGGQTKEEIKSRLETLFGKIKEKNSNVIIIFGSIPHFNFINENDVISPVGSIILTKENGWIGAYDIVDTDPNAEYYINESSVPLNWTVSYENQYQKIGSSTPITAKNTRNIPKTSLSVEKTWKNDIPNSPARDNISLALLQSTDQKNWVECDVGMPEPTKTKNADGEDVWTYNYANLPAVDNFGKPYYYKVEEAPMTGYTTSYGEPNVIKSENGGNAGKLTVTNTATISLKLSKIWSDIDTNNHQGDSVTFTIHRAVKIDGDNPRPGFDKDSLYLEVDKTNVGVTVNSTVTVTANKPVTFTQSEGSESAFNASLSDDKTIITITGKAEGSGTITVTDGTNEVTINVTVSAYKLWIDDSDAEESFTITAGENNHKLSVTKGGAAFSDVTYSSSNTSVLNVSDDGTITTVDAGTATVTVSTGGNVILTQEITVQVPTDFTLSSEDEKKEVKIDRDYQLDVNPKYGTFEWKSLDESKATVDNTGKVHGVSEGSVTIRVTRTNDNKIKYIELNVVKAGEVTYSVKTVSGGENQALYIANKADVYVSKIVINVKSHEGQRIWVALANSSTHLEWSQSEGGFAISDYGTLNASDASNCSVSISGNIITVTDFKVSQLNQILFQYTNMTADLEVTFYYSEDAPVSQSLSLRSASQPQMLVGAGIAESADTPTTRSQSVTFNAAGEATVTLSGGRLGGWETVIENLDVYAQNGQEYIYWVEEVAVNGYETNYQFSDGDSESTAWINASKPNSDGELVVTVRNNKTDTPGYELPSTGGGGVKVYYYTGAAMILLSAIAGSNRIRRRLKERRTK